jgi:hypothetical protein
MGAGLPTKPMEHPSTDGSAPPMLSLCLATYNRARYLDRYLTHHLTALEAAGIDYELVVSDNCSTDETPEILARYASRFPRMRVTRRPTNVGAHPNILTTLHQARGEVIVSISDDDMAVPDQLMAYVRRMIDDPSLVMIQAPWLLVDETRDGAVTGQFYRLDGESRFGRGDYAGCLGFVIERHVFPECWLMRRSALASIAGPVPRFAYSYFCMLANALGMGDVLFCPEPHIAATAVSMGDNAHVGNTEAMEAWDTYRGGLEMLASYARQTNPAALADPNTLGASIHTFVSERMAVAARLHGHAGNWADAYQLLRRLHAYGFNPTIGFDRNEVAILAAVEMALLECRQRGAGVIVVGETLPDHVLERLNPVEGARITRPDGVGPGDATRAYCSVGGAAEPSMREGDFIFDIVPTMDRFPRFSAQ